MVSHPTSGRMSRPVIAARISAVAEIIAFVVHTETNWDTRRMLDLSESLTLWVVPASFLLSCLACRFSVVFGA
jgi:hypothetical protein